jgi:acyl-CoA dehydrogenase
MNFTDINPDLAEIRDGVAKVCAGFPGEYWRQCDAGKLYPEEFVSALMKEGYLAAMIPESYGGSGLNLTAASVILEEIHRHGCNAAACHAQMYTMGTVLRHGSDEQKKKYLPKIADGSLRLQAFGVTEPTSGTDTLALKTTATRDATSSRDRKFGHRALHNQILCCCLPAQRRATRSRKKPTVSLSS